MPDSLAQRVRAKYPGVYDDLSDSELDAKVRAKYPGVYDDLPGASEPPSLVQRFGQAMAETSPLSAIRKTPDFLRGATAGVLSTAYHGGDLIRRATGMERIIDKPEVQAEMQPPANNAGKAGFIAEQGAEWAYPLSKVTHAAAALPWLGRMAIEGAAGAGVAGVQTGGDPTTMAAGAAFPVVGSLALKGASAGVNAVRATAAGAKEGGLGGAVASLVRSTVPAAPKSMLTQALKPRNVKVNFGETLERAVPELKAAEAALGKPIEGVDDLIAAAKAAKQANRAQYAQLQGPQHAMGSTVDLTPVADAIEQSIPLKVQTENPVAAAAMRRLAATYRRRFDLGDAEQLLRETNAELEGYYSKFPAARAKAAAANPEVAHLVAQAKELRTAIYDTLDAPGQGTAARELQRRYGALMEVEDAAYRRMNVAARQQPESLSEQIGKVRAAADMARGLWKLKSLDATGLADIAAARAGAAAGKFLKDQQTTDALIRRAFAAHAGLPVPIEMPPPVRIAGELPPATIRLGGGPDPSYARAVPAEPGIPLREGVIVDEAIPTPQGLPSGRTGAKALPPASFRMPASTTQGARVSGPPAPDYMRRLGLEQEPPVSLARGGERSSAPRQLPERATPTPEDVPPAAPEPPSAGPVAAPAPAPAASRAPSVSPDDIPRDLAERAHNGTSWVPEQRAQGEQRNYVAHMESVWDDLSQRATTPEQQAAARAEFSRYRANYTAKYRDLLSRRGRMVSTNIAGPSRFPARQQEKIHDAYGKALNEFVEWDNRARKAMVQAVDPTAPRAISADRSDAVEALQAKVDTERKVVERMKAANVIVRNTKLTDDEKIAQMVSSLGFKESRARELLKPDFAGRKGFADYEFKNTGANIRRMEARIAEIGETRATPARGTTFEGGRIEENADANRIQIHFDAKPDEAMRAKLKAHGFKWAPSQGVWQRQRTDNARIATEHIFGVKLQAPEAAPVEPAAPRGRGSIEPTPDLAHAASMDAGNRSMKAAGRTAWNEDDYNAAAATYDRVLPPPEAPAAPVVETSPTSGRKPNYRYRAVFGDQQSVLFETPKEMHAFIGKRMGAKVTGFERMDMNTGTVEPFDPAMPARAPRTPKAPPKAPIASTEPAPTVVLPAQGSAHDFVAQLRAKQAADLKPEPTWRAKAAAKQAATKVDTPAEAAEKVANQVERVIDVSGEKSAGAIQMRVMKALEMELAGADAVGKAGTIEIKGVAGSRMAWVFEDGERVAEIDNKGRMTWANYAQKDIPANQKIRGTSLDNSFASVVPYGGKYTHSQTQQRSAIQQVRQALNEHRGGFEKLVVRIPGDGVFTINRTPEAINELLRRMKVAGPSIWKDLAKTGKKATGR